MQQAQRPQRDAMLKLAQGYLNLAALPQMA
jgi:hypothetical protein